MAVTDSAPLYMEVVKRILKELRISQQVTGEPFDYFTFKNRLEMEELTVAQKGPLKQRMDTLESFMVQRARFGKNRAATPCGIDWTPKVCHIPCPRRTLRAFTKQKQQASQLTIVDLSCPCVTADTACSLFNICLSLFLEQPSSVGRVIALDEAHKYMTASESPECATLTTLLLETIRLQRHLGARVIIATQEPTVSPAMLDLCSVTIVHRFSSPAWLRTLREHLAGASTAGLTLRKLQDRVGGSAAEDGEGLGESEGKGPAANGALSLQTKDPAFDLFGTIVGLRPGEGLLFAPNAVLEVGPPVEGRGSARVKRLDHGILKIRIRQRVTADGGRSVMAG